MGAVLLWVADQLTQANPIFKTELPTGVVTAVLGGILMLWMLPKLRSMQDPSRTEMGQSSRRLDKPWLILFATAPLLCLTVWATMALGQNPNGWSWSTGTELAELLPWRWPRVTAALAAGAMMAMSGTLVQRLTGNAMASPEILGISSGATLDEHEYVLVLAMHHIISDGWSMQVLVDEFVELYTARVQGRSPALNPLPIQYADYAVWQHDWMAAGERDRQLTYWKQQLGDEHPVLQLPEVLGVERIGRNDNFFTLGGDSILSLKVVARARKRGVRLLPRQIFEYQRLIRIAQAIEDKEAQLEVVVPPNLIPEGCEAIKPEMLTLVELNEQEIARIEVLVPDGAANIQDIYPLAPLQEGILFHHLLQDQGDAYVTSHTLSFDSRELLEEFITHLNKVVSRHDILRTAVLWEGLREPVQVVLRAASLKIFWLDEHQARIGPETKSEITDANKSLPAVANATENQIDVRQAPMLKAACAFDPTNSSWTLQLSSHHLILDHITSEYVINEINIYQQGRIEKLSDPIPFRKFVAQARLSLSQAEHEKFFRAQLGDVEEPTAPFNLLDVHGDGSSLEEVRTLLVPELADKVRQQANRYAVSPATLFHLAWALVLAKVTGKDDVVFGTVLFGRLQGTDGADQALGMFLNTLPVRVYLGGRTIEHSIREMHLALTNLIRHEYASLVLAQRCSGLPGGIPLFSSFLNYRYSRRIEERDDLSGWDGVRKLRSVGRTNYPLGMSIDDLGDGFRLVAQVHKEVDAARVCELMRISIEELAAAMATSPSQRMNELQVVAEDEVSQIMQWSWNSPLSMNQHLIHREIEQKAETYTDVVSLECGDTRVTYGELNRRANQLAHHLIDLGVGPDVPVGIAVERSIEMVVGMLAILKAGGAYVPLDPEYPAERLAYMIEDSGIELLLTQSHLRDHLPVGEGVAVLELDTLDVSGQSDQNPQVPVHAENLMYVIYTSGSTGRPKGVANRHGAVTNRLLWMQQAYQLTEADAVLQKTPFSFDVSVWEFFWPLMQGARLVMAQPGDHKDPARLVELINQHNVTTLHFVPSMLQAFLAYGALRECAGLTRIVCSGERHGVCRGLMLILTAFRIDRVMLSALCAHIRLRLRILIESYRAVKGGWPICPLPNNCGSQFQERKAVRPATAIVHSRFPDRLTIRCSLAFRSGKLLDQLGITLQRCLVQHHKLFAR